MATLLALLTGLVVLAAPEPTAALSWRSYSTNNGSPTEPALWVDDAGRLYGAWAEPFIFSSSGPTTPGKLQIVRLNSDGTADASFGTGGRRSTTMALPPAGPTGCGALPRIAVSGVSFTPSGEVVVAHYRSAALRSCLDQPMLDRYSLDGTRLARFDSGIPGERWGGATSEGGFWRGHPVGATTAQLVDPSGGGFPVPESSGVVDHVPGGPIYLTSSLAPDPGVRIQRVNGGAIDLDTTVACGSTWFGPRVRVMPGVGTAYAVVCFVPEPGSSNGTINVTYLGATTWTRTLAGRFSTVHAGYVTGSGQVLVNRGCADSPPGTGSCGEYAWVAETGPTPSFELFGVGPDQVIPLPDGCFASGAVDQIPGNDPFIDITRHRCATTPAVPAKTAKPTSVPGASKVDLTWTAPSSGGSPITGYRITPFRNGVAQPPIDVGATTNRAITGLDNGATYRFTVAARNAQGLGPDSDLSDPAVPGARPAAPTNVKATTQTGQATVTWTAPPTIPGLPITGYSLIVIADGVRLQAVDIGSGTTEIVPDLRPGVLYRFEISARNAVGTSTASAASNTVTPPIPAFKSHGGAAKRLSGEILGRTPTPTEQATWAGQMESGARTPGALVADLRARPESTTKVDPAARLYTAYFLRRPDAPGLNYWITQLRAGRSNRWVAEFFARSPEFQQRYGTLTNRQFVELIYRNVLGRPGEASGVEYWTGRLDSGTNTRGWVMVGFSESAEYKRAQASEVEVAVLYTLLLGRAPTPAEYTADVTALDDGTTIATLAQRLITSPEYATRSTP